MLSGLQPNQIQYILNWLIFKEYIIQDWQLWQTSKTYFPAASLSPQSPIFILWIGRKCPLTTSLNDAETMGKSFLIYLFFYWHLALNPALSAFNISCKAEEWNMATMTYICNICHIIISASLFMSFIIETEEYTNIDTTTLEI